MELENFVSRHRFDENIGRIDDALKELIDKFKSSVSESNDTVTDFVVQHTKDIKVFKLCFSLRKLS